MPNAARNEVVVISSDDDLIPKQPPARLRAGHQKAALGNVISLDSESDDDSADSDTDSNADFHFNNAFDPIRRDAIAPDLDLADADAGLLNDGFFDYFPDYNELPVAPMEGLKKEPLRMESDAMPTRATTLRVGAALSRFGSLGSEKMPPLSADDPTRLFDLFKERVLEMFPDVCPQSLHQTFEMRARAPDGHLLAMTLDEISQSVIDEILENPDYPRQPPPAKGKKRKRSENEDSDVIQQQEYLSKDRPPLNERAELRGVFLAEFPDIPLSFIDDCLRRHKNLYPAYQALEAAMLTCDTVKAKFRKLKKSRMVPRTTFLPWPQVQKELEFARRKSQHEKDVKRKQEEEAAADEALTQKALAEGDVIECQCCFDEIPTVKSTHCSGDPCHFFCQHCAKNTAKAQIELQRYKISCMDGSGCQADFTRCEKIRFLDSNCLSILERLQQQDELLKAEIEGLEQCPRCDYAEIYPPVEENKVFECKNNACDVVAICRVCRKDSHLPKTCEEYQKELGVSERNAVAEAMTEALIRKCPKCSVAIIKQDGCNKMTCSKCGCYFCDVCKKDISKETYRHFTSNGPCRQTDNHFVRDDKRIKEAEESAKAKILSEHTDLKEEDLAIKFSDAVSKQDSNDRANTPAFVHLPIGNLGDVHANAMQQQLDLRERAMLVQRRLGQRQRAVEEARVAAVPEQVLPGHRHRHLAAEAAVRTAPWQNDIAAGQLLEAQGAHRAAHGADEPHIPPFPAGRVGGHGEAHFTQPYPETGRLMPRMPPMASMASMASMAPMPAQLLGPTAPNNTLPRPLQYDWRAAVVGPLPYYNQLREMKWPLVPHNLQPTRPGRPHHVPLHQPGPENINFRADHERTSGTQHGQERPDWKLW